VPPCSMDLEPLATGKSDFMCRIWLPDRVPLCDDDDSLPWLRLECCIKGTCKIIIFCFILVMAYSKNSDSSSFAGLRVSSCEHYRGINPHCFIYRPILKYFQPTNSFCNRIICCSCNDLHRVVQKVSTSEFSINRTENPKMWLDLSSNLRIKKYQNIISWNSIFYA